MRHSGIDLHAHRQRVNRHGWKIASIYILHWVCMRIKLGLILWGIENKRYCAILTYFRSIETEINFELVVLDYNGGSIDLCRHRTVIKL